jgi:hypothetical protein
MVWAYWLLLEMVWASHIYTHPPKKNTTAAKQLLRGRPPFRGEWEHIPCFFGGRMRCFVASESPCLVLESAFLPLPWAVVGHSGGSITSSTGLWPQAAPRLFQVCAFPHHRLFEDVQATSNNSNPKPTNAQPNSLGILHATTWPTTQPPPGATATPPTPPPAPPRARCGPPLSGFAALVANNKS